MRARDCTSPLLLVIASSLLASCATGPSTPGTSAFQQRPSRVHRQSSCPCLYVANFGSNTITVYSLNAKAKHPPIQKIKGHNTGLDGPIDIAVDVNGKMYVANHRKNSVTVYAPGTTGNVTPLATIAGPSTELDDPTGIALDPVTGDVYVANGQGGSGNGSVTIYSPDASGNVTPIGAIAGSNTGLFNPSELRLDASGNIYVPNEQYDTITVYAAGSTGNVAPSQQISGYYTRLLAPTAVALTSSSSSATIYEANDITGSGAAVNVFSPGSHGNVPPIQRIAGSKTKLATADGIALDGGGKIYVANYYPGKIAVYAADANGNVKPIEVRKGLANPEGIFIR